MRNKTLFARYWVEEWMRVSRISTAIYVYADCTHSHLESPVGCSDGQMVGSAHRRARNVRYSNIVQNGASIFTLTRQTNAAVACALRTLYGVMHFVRMYILGSLFARHKTK